MRRMFLIGAALTVLVACDPSTYLSSQPITSARGATPAVLYTYPVPLCLIICTAHISSIREDAISTGDGSLTTGAKSNTSSSSSSNQ